jgi:hypothetical protein
MVSVRLLILAALAVVGGFAPDARADDCDEITPVDDARRVEQPAPVRSTEVVVPCAAIDSGLVGADCADAFYVLSPQGVTLCRVDLMAWTTADDTPSVQHDDVEVHGVDGFAPAALLAMGPDPLRPPVARPVAAARVARDSGPADAHRSGDPRPS